jgi:hypothetical protein
MSRNFKKPSTLPVGQARRIDKDKVYVGAQTVQARTGPILIKKQCEHVSCPLGQCVRSDLRFRGIAI